MSSIGSLASSREMMEALSRELARCARYDRPFSALLIGVDQPGDPGVEVSGSYARALGRLISRDVRSSDLVGRYGEAELLVLLPETPRQGALVVAERLLANAKRLPQSMTAAGRPPQPEIAIGVVEYGADTRSVHDFLNAAERALQEARGQSGNRMQVAESPRQEQPMGLRPVR